MSEAINEGKTHYVGDSCVGGHAELQPVTPAEGPYYFDGISYVFKKEADGNSQMVCEVRGAGAGLFEQHAKLIVDSLNCRQSMRAEVDAWKAKYQKEFEALGDYVGKVHFLEERWEKLNPKLQLIALTCTCVSNAHSEMGRWPNCPRYLVAKFLEELESL